MTRDRTTCERGFSYGDENSCYRSGVIRHAIIQKFSEKETKGVVFNLNLFNGKLLAGINGKIVFYRWMLHDDGSRELQYEYSMRRELEEPSLLS